MQTKVATDSNRQLRFMIYRYIDYGIFHKMLNCYWWCGWCWWCWWCWWCCCCNSISLTWWNRVKKSWYKLLGCAFISAAPWTTLPRPTSCSDWNGSSVIEKMNSRKCHISCAIISFQAIFHLSHKNARMKGIAIISL